MESIRKFDIEENCDIVIDLESFVFGYNEDLRLKMQPIFNTFYLVTAQSIDNKIKENEKFIH